MTVGENIRKIRLERKLTQKELGEKLGISQSAIGQFEDGKANPKIGTIDRIASALKVDITDLITDLKQDECIAATSTMHLTEREERLIFGFRELNDQKQEYIITTMTLVKNML